MSFHHPVMPNPGINSSRVRPKVIASRTRQVVSSSFESESSVIAIHVDPITDEIMAVLKLDNVTMGQTNWKPCSQQAWDQRYSFNLDKSRELEIDIYWRDWRSLCAVKFLRLEEFVDDVRHGMALQLEPQGLLFAEVSLPTNLYYVHRKYVSTRSSSRSNSSTL